VTEVIVDADAHLTLYQLQEESKNSFHIGGLFAKLGRGSRFDAFAITLAGGLVRNDLRVDLDGAGAEVNLRGLYLARGRQHIDNHTQIFHNEPGCISHEHYKGVLDDRARAVFHGRIVVQPDAQKTVSEQSNQNLLLSRDAEIDTKPQLEIYADDVKCAHGATVGQLDKDALFYLRSRGIAEEMAKRLLIKAFASDVLLAVSPDSLREHLLTRVEMMLTD
jgi:Fe-S cluster assembly protein SufD